MFQSTHAALATLAADPINTTGITGQLKSIFWAMLFVAAIYAVYQVIKGHLGKAVTTAVGIIVALSIFGFGEMGSGLASFAVAAVKTVLNIG